MIAPFFGVSFDHTLNMQPFVVHKDGEIDEIGLERYLYDLFAVIAHSGNPSQ